VADVAPLRGENRIFVRRGLPLIADSKSLGLRALVRAAGLDTKEITAGRVGFILAPRLNALGRIGRALDGVHLLLGEREDECNQLARQCEELNRERQELDRSILDEALRRVGQMDLNRTWGLVLHGEGWHPGVIGIVASRVQERVARPVFLVAFDGETGKGSGRSVAGCDLHAVLARCAPLLEKWGGHRMAAGLTIARGRLDAFREAFNAACAEQVAAESLVPTQRVDAVVPIGAITDELERLVRALEPTGMGNPGPVFGLEGLRLRGGLRPIGERHVRFALTDGDAVLETVAFGVREEVELVVGAARGPLRAAVRLDRDTWKGRDRLEGRLLTLAAE
jgi:single-stranded-DNA-specific exonuclease